MQPKTGNKPIEITIEDIANSLGVIIDCRSSEEYELSHMDNAINIPLQHLSIRQDSFPCRKEDTFFVYCKTGNRSNTFILYLRSIGYSNCQSIAGGFESWRETKTC